MEKEMTARNKFDYWKRLLSEKSSTWATTWGVTRDDLEFLIRYAEAARETAAKWAWRAQIESGEGIDPGMGMSREVVDAEIEEAMKRE